MQIMGDKLLVTNPKQVAKTWSVKAQNAASQGQTGTNPRRAGIRRFRWSFEFANSVQHKTERDKQHKAVTFPRPSV